MFERIISLLPQTGLRGGSLVGLGGGMICGGVSVECCVEISNRNPGIINQGAKSSLLDVLTFANWDRKIVAVPRFFHDMVGTADTDNGEAKPAKGRQSPLPSDRRHLRHSRESISQLRRVVSDVRCRDTRESHRCFQDIQRRRPERLP